MILQMFTNHKSQIMSHHFQRTAANLYVQLTDKQLIQYHKRYIISTRYFNKVSYDIANVHKSQITSRHVQRTAAKLYVQLTYIDLY